MKRYKWMQFVGLLFAITILIIFWTIAYFLTNYLYQTMDIQVSSWMQQIITSLLGMILLFITIFIISRFNKKMVERREQFLQSITDAMQQIAAGDFNVNIEYMHRDNNPQDPFGKIVENINEMAKQLGEVENMRQEFISNVSHEIQSPLTSISGFARALKSDQVPERERQHYLTIIEKESKRLSNISDNLLKLTYLEADNQELTFKEYRLDKQLQRIVLACEPQWQEKNITIELHAEKTFLTANEELMNQVWLNLINNAIKFTDKDGNVRITIIDTETAITITVRDTGIGISTEEKLHLFERFYKADKARSSHTSGSGLGLSIVKKIITLHKANIKVNSDATGTSFSVIFQKSPLPLKGVKDK